MFEEVENKLQRLSPDLRAQFEGIKKRYGERWVEQILSHSPPEVVAVDYEHDLHRLLHVAIAQAKTIGESLNCLNHGSSHVGYEESSRLDGYVERLCRDLNGFCDDAISLRGERTECPLKSAHQELINTMRQYSLFR